MNKLWIRLTLSFLGVTLLVIGLMAFAIQQSVSYSFDTYVTQSNMARFGGDLMHGLEDYYAQNKTWQGVESLLPTGRGGQGNNEGEGGAGRGAQGAQIFVADTQGIIVASTQEEWVGANVADIGQSRQIDLMQGTQRIGTLGEQTLGRKPSIKLRHASCKISAPARSWWVFWRVVLRWAWQLLWHIR
jgi:hypothetical protein